MAGLHKIYVIYRDDCGMWTDNKTKIFQIVQQFILLLEKPGFI